MHLPIAGWGMTSMWSSPLYSWAPPATRTRPSPGRRLAGNITKSPTVPRSTPSTAASRSIGRVHQSTSASLHTLIVPCRQAEKKGHGQCNSHGAASLGAPASKGGCLCMTIPLNLFCLIGGRRWVAAISQAVSAGLRISTTAFHAELDYEPIRLRWSRTEVIPVPNADGEFRLQGRALWPTRVKCLSRSG